VNALLNKNPE